ncbi:MAG: hypothetical protein RBT38_06540 [Bacteroidales bacterium]|jgi:hypothetical protein|nr:hypothetical protein [Bacteroidales bacterium]
MEKKLAAMFSLMIILAFMGYIIFDATRGSGNAVTDIVKSDTSVEDTWVIDRSFNVSSGKLSSVAVSDDGIIFLGGDSFVMALTSDLAGMWDTETETRITALAVSGDTLFASTTEAILLYSASGDLIGEWGPYEGNSLITSVSVNSKYLAFADAGNKRVFLLDRKGEVIKMIGQSDNNFVIPSPYFDVDLDNNLLYAANTGYRRVETWSLDGRKLSEFGEAGTAPGAFCGCCNPAHFSSIPQGFVTAEKGINRIQILDREGNFIEFVSSHNSFSQSVPLDVASADGVTIFAANSDDNNLYLFKRK